jgi:hypothetical protein
MKRLIMLILSMFIWTNSSFALRDDWEQRDWQKRLHDESLEQQKRLHRENLESQKKLETEHHWQETKRQWVEERIALTQEVIACSLISQKPSATGTDNLDQLCKKVMKKFEIRLEEQLKGVQ